MISLIAFVLVAFAMFGIEKKRSYGQALMFVSQIFWLWSAAEKNDMWLGVQSVVLGAYTIKVWWVWFKSDRGIR